MIELLRKTLKQRTVENAVDMADIGHNGTNIGVS